jgi:hypothetical protein
MPVFEMIRYHNKKYPDDMMIEVEEIAGHFDVMGIAHTMKYSLHTEYSYGKRSFKNGHLDKYINIVNANKNGVPMLWYDIAWAMDFANFIISLTSNCEHPKYIEIHPPFSDYTNSLHDFMEKYKIFEDIVLNYYPGTQILIENRSGSLYKNGVFCVSTVEQIIELANELAKTNSSLRITLDIPQLYTAHGEVIRDKRIYGKLLNSLVGVRNYIDGVHLWGKRTTDKGKRVPHTGDLNSYFLGDEEAKNIFLLSIHNLFNDGVKRNMVLEVNSGNDDMISIINDLQRNGFEFL